MASNNITLAQTLRSHLIDVNRTIDSIVQQANSLDIDPYSMRNDDGSWTLGPLLLAKSNTLLALSQLGK